MPLGGVVARFQQLCTLNLKTRLIRVLPLIFYKDNNIAFHSTRRSDPGELNPVDILITPMQGLNGCPKTLWPDKLRKMEMEAKQHPCRQ